MKTNNSNNYRRPSPRSRHYQVRQSNGSTYLLVVSVAVIAAVVGLGSIGIASSKRRASILEQNYSRVGRLAQSAVDLGVQQVGSDLDWRTSFNTIQDGQYTDRIRLGSGFIRWSLVDPVDGNIGNSASDPVRILGQGTYQSAKRTFSVLVWPTGRALDVLRTCIHSNQDVTVSGHVIAGLGPVSTNTEIVDDDGTIYGSVEANSGIDDRNSNFVAGSKIATHPVKTMPSTQVYPLYRSLATKIEFSALPVSGSISNFVLDSTSNPYGEANSAGIYRILVPASTTLTIQDCQIEGTLLVELSGPDARFLVDSGVIWKPAKPNLPSMLVFTTDDNDTDVELKCSGFNTATATRASLRGLFHVIRDVDQPSSMTTISAENRIVGTVISDGPIELTGACHLVADRSLISNPPHGYTTAISSTNFVTNGDILNGLEFWLPSDETEFGGGARLNLATFDSASYVVVSNRKSAADGVIQDITPWVENGNEIAGTAKMRMASSGDTAKIIVEVVNESGEIFQQTSTTSIATSQTNVAFSITPSWTGQLKSARLIFCTTQTKNDFALRNVTVARSSTRDVPRLTSFPSTWQAEISN